MTISGWFGTGCPTRGTPALRRARSPRAWGLIVLALAALVQSGCQSGACGPCGKLKQKMGQPPRAGLPRAGLGGVLWCGGGDHGGPDRVRDAGLGRLPWWSRPPIRAGSCRHPTTRCRKSSSRPRRRRRPARPPTPPLRRGRDPRRARPITRHSGPGYGTGRPRGENLARALIPNPEPTTRSARGRRSPRRPIRSTTSPRSTSPRRWAATSPGTARRRPRTRAPPGRRHLAGRVGGAGAGRRPRRPRAGPRRRGEERRARHPPLRRGRAQARRGEPPHHGGPGLARREGVQDGPRPARVGGGFRPPTPRK